MNDKEYNALPGIRRSDLWKMNKTPMHFQYSINNPTAPTPALLFGQAAHKYILEHSIFFDEFAVYPVVDKRTKTGREMIQRFEESNTEKTWIDHNMFDTIVQMRDALMSVPEIAEILNGDIRTEVPFYWTDDETGEICKCKADIVGMYHGEPAVFDYKTTLSCDDGAFERDARKYGYAFQTGFYTSGINKCTFEKHRFVFIAQEKEAPYAARIYECDDSFVNAGTRKFRKLLNEYHRCKTENDWRGYQTETLYAEVYE